MQKKVSSLTHILILNKNKMFKKTRAQKKINPETMSVALVINIMR